MQGLAAQIRALSDARAARSTGETDAEKTIRRLSHSLKGSGATYGFPRVTEVARAVEEAPAADLEARLDELLLLLESIVSEESHANAPHSVMIVEDDPAMTDLLVEALSMENREITALGRLSDAEAHMNEKFPSLVVLDLVLPDGDGRTLLTRIRNRPSLAGIPVIVVSALGEAAVRTECLALGADAFLVKPLNPSVLLTTATNLLQRTLSQARAVRRDSLTELANRAAFHEALERQKGIAKRSGEPLAVAILDLDRFKTVNDTYGHRTGDQVLRRMARIVEQALRKTDFFARWGGEEFVAFFPNANAQGARLGLEKALEAMRSEIFTSEDGRTFPLTFSAGVVDADVERSVDENVAAADRLLYLAKSTGRNRVISPQEETSAGRERPRILFVEDDAMIAAVTKRRLEQEGFAVEHFGAGEPAIEKAVEGGFAFAILDVNLPGMNGFEILEKLRSTHATRALPVMMLTAVGNEKSIVRAFELGADDYMTKPFSPAELLARVIRLLKKAGMWRPGVNAS